MTTPMNTPHQPDPVFESALYHAAMRAHYLRAANTDTAQRRSHLHAARRHEWCVVNLAIKAEVQAQRQADAQAVTATLVGALVELAQAQLRESPAPASVALHLPLQPGQAQQLADRLMPGYQRCTERLQILQGLIASLRPAAPVPAAASQPPGHSHQADPGAEGAGPAPHRHFAAQPAPCAGPAPQPSAREAHPAQWGGLS